MNTAVIRSVYVTLLTNIQLSNTRMRTTAVYMVKCACVVRYRLCTAPME